jgi:2-Cys peroxiredoxin 5
LLLRVLSKIQTQISQIRFLGDPTAKFTEALDLAFDGTAIFGGPRSKRYALEIGEDGKVTALHVEPDNTGLDGKPLQPITYQNHS